ncbi:Retrovirus-related Pol polyprotein from transposon 297 [Eumeta japonica]|uniref:Retrovirus-related Pol polyprotein from transposon 297 n=1 Tax=Eumeta variegata TaxID=151549 RepID=A0A4C1V3F9_EUMVA|nr:Retrovirus-related Pol polyprotein from transposon 297 [Eumeta japonica]
MNPATYKAYFDEFPVQPEKFEVKTAHALSQHQGSITTPPWNRIFKKQIEEPHKFYLFHFSDKYNVLFGLDILRQAGMKIKGNHLKLGNNTIELNYNSEDIEIDLENLFQQYKKKITEDVTDSVTSKVKHEIKLTDDSPIYQRPFRLPQTQRTEVRKQLKKLLKENVISPSDSPWASPVHLVPKKLDNSGQKKFRLVIDYGKLNEKTRSDRYALPNIEDILTQLNNSKYFSTIDLTSGYHQISMDKNSIEKTAFITPEEHFESLCILFGLKNAPATFQRMMNEILKGLNGNICLVYRSINDVPVTAEKRRRDTYSSPTPTLEPAPKKVDQRSSLNTDTPRSSSLEPYAESTQDSTTYAALTVAFVGYRTTLPPTSSWWHCRSLTFRRRRGEFPLLPPLEEFADHPKVRLSSRPGTSDGGPSDATRDRAYSRVDTCDGAAADSTAKGSATTRDATDSTDLQATSDTDDNEPKLPTARTVGHSNPWLLEQNCDYSRPTAPLQDAEDYGNEVLGPDTTLHVPTDSRFGTDVLDIVFCHRVPFPIHVEVIYDMDTQDLPILIMLGTTAHLTLARPQTHRTNWSAYLRTLEELHIGKSFSSSEEVELAALHLNQKIQTAYGAATTHLPAPTNRRWDLPPRLQCASQHKRNLQRLWAKTRCPRVKRVLNRVAQELRQEEEQFTPHPASDSHAITAHHEEGEHRVQEFLSAPIPPPPGDYYMSPAEKARTILRLPRRKVPGPDGIPTIANKQLPRRAMVAMTRLFDGILRTGHCPCWM